ncbi:MAG: RNA-directed DNA polymerase, partial [Patescibacteria group bacterium]|nr:RNA-directed DNA polymerase [Patescibacteria group bacterium]
PPPLSSGSTTSLSRGQGEIMRVIKINKGGGKVRVVYSPDRREKRRLQRLLPQLAEAERLAARAAGTEQVAHGFVRDRSPITCARVHRGHAVTICCDLAGWFDSVRPEQVSAGLMLAGLTLQSAGALVSRVCIAGESPSPRAGELAPRQGLPTSPAAANLAAVELDRHILAALASLPCRWAYTRYADDLSISLATDSPEGRETVLTIIRAAVAAMGWSLAERKTRIQSARAGRRVIVGVSVDQDIQAPRSMRRRLRAATHQGRVPQAQGLAQWCAMRLPRAARPSRQIPGVAVLTTPNPVPGKSPPAKPATVLTSARRIQLGG